MLYSSSLRFHLPATFALFLSSPIPLGGLAFTPQAIGLVLGCAGIFHGLFQAFFFPRIHKRWEPRNVYAVSIVAYIPIYLCMPIMNALAKRAGQVTPLVWICLPLLRWHVHLRIRLSVSHLSLPFIVNVS